MNGVLGLVLSSVLSSVLASGPTLSAWASAVLVEASEKLGLDAFITGTGQCPATAKVCVGLHVHPVVRKIVSHDTLEK